MRSQRLLDF